MLPTTCAAAARSPRPALSQAVLLHLGSLLRDAVAPGDRDHFAALVSRLDAAMPSASSCDAMFRADLLRFMPNLHRYAISARPWFANYSIRTEEAIWVFFAGRTQIDRRVAAPWQSLFEEV